MSDQTARITSRWGEIQPNQHEGPSTCRSCGQVVQWVLTRNGKRMPIDPETDESHFKTCPQADQHRQGGASPAGEGAGKAILARLDAQDRVLAEILKLLRGEP